MGTDRMTRAQFAALRGRLERVPHTDHPCAACLGWDLADAVETLLTAVEDYERLAEEQRPPSNGVGTSNAAADSLSAVGLNDRRRAVLATMGGALWTAEQLADRLGWNGNTLRPRLIECRRAGWVEDSGARFTTRSGRLAVAWRLTEAGRLRLAAP